MLSAATPPAPSMLSKFAVGDVVRWDRLRYISDLDRGNLAVLEARRMPDIFGQVVEVDRDQVQVIWENGRRATYTWHSQGQYLVVVP